MKYDYNIYPDNSSDAFLKAVRKIKTELLDFKEIEPLIDVDGSVTRIFIFNGKEIIICDDYYVGAVYVKSDIDLSHLFE